MNRGFSNSAFRWNAELRVGGDRYCKKKKKKRCANSDEIARVNSGTERGGSSRVGSDRVGSGRVGSGRRLTGRSARHARQWRTENDRAKSWPNSDLYRKRLPLHPIPDSGKIFRGFYNSLARFARCNRDKNKGGRNIREKTTISEWFWDKFLSPFNLYLIISLIKIEWKNSFDSLTNLIIDYIGFKRSSSSSIWSDDLENNCYNNRSKNIN